MHKNPWFDSDSSLTTSAFEVVYKKLALPLTKFIVKKVGGNQEAVDEVFSRTITSAWKGWNTFEHKSSYFTWLCRIALNKIADYYREQIHEESVFVAPLLEDIAHIEDNNLSCEEKLALQEIRVAIRNCINLLPLEKQQLLYLRYWRALTIKQIAKQFGVSERAIEGKIYRAKQLLKETLVNKHPEIAKSYTQNALI